MQGASLHRENALHDQNQRTIQLLQAVTIIDIDENGAPTGGGDGYIVLEHGATRRAAKQNRVARRDVSQDDVQTEVVAWVAQHLAELSEESGCTWVVGYRRGATGPCDTFKVSGNQDLASGLGTVGDLGPIGALALTLEKTVSVLLATHRADAQVIKELSIGHLDRAFDSGKLIGAIATTTDLEAEKIRAETLKAVVPAMAPILGQLLAGNKQSTAASGASDEGTQPESDGPDRITWGLGICESLATDTMRQVASGVELTEEHKAQILSLHEKLGAVVAALGASG